MNLSPGLFDSLENGGPLSVGEFLEMLNLELVVYEMEIYGEVSGVGIRKGHCYFDLKDQAAGVIHCIIWHSKYALCGIELRDGMRVKLFGHPNIYVPIGKLSFLAESVEPFGEGELKKAYEQLKEKLDAEGLFSTERKQPLPEFPRKIGVITSKTGAVISDFLNNIGRYGFRIMLYDSLVEGIRAAPEIVDGIRFFQLQNDVDLIVLIRGGGSFESLSAFNNEMLVREIAACPIPVIAGIGHDKDVPLACLAADSMESTPTAVATALNAPWLKAESRMRLAEREIIHVFERIWSRLDRQLDNLSSALRHFSERYSERFSAVANGFLRQSSRFGMLINRKTSDLQNARPALLSGFFRLQEQTEQRMTKSADLIRANDPERLLKLGYGIVFSNKKVVRSIDDVQIKEEIDILVADGTIFSRIEDVKRN